MPSNKESLAIEAPAPSEWVKPAERVSVTIQPAEPALTERKRCTSVEDKHYRSLLKAISWRATGTLDTILISFLITGKIKLAVSIGLVEVFTKIGLFYVHERLWAKVRLGRARVPEDYTI
ncbi:MAG TPA: DUF2061 domain-containing protein [Clostridia bacterium]|jgi:uncharacterized membrane protein|nr:DUF2061 domain-containing protein [Clostridia bacterium]